MENAACGVADVVRSTLARTPAARVLIACGRGNNGGDGYALARHLYNDGVEVVLLRLGEPAADSDARINHDICVAMDLPFITFDEIEQAGEVDLIVDAIFGTGLDRPVECEAAEVIEWINALTTPVVSIDLPSGLDCDTGRPLGIAVRATMTVSFLGWKKGFLAKGADEFVGEISVAHIGAPRDLFGEFGERIRAGAR